MHRRSGACGHPQVDPPHHLIAGEEDANPTVGIWGQRHLRWLRENQRVTYTNFLTSGKLHCYLIDIDRHVNELLDLLIKQMAVAEGVTEQLKAADQMEWVQRMNSIRSRAEEIVITELIAFYLSWAHPIRLRSFFHITSGH